MLQHITCLLLFFATSTYAASPTYTFDIQDQSIQETLLAIAITTEHDIIFSDAVGELTQKVNLNGEYQLDEALLLTLKDTTFTFTLQGSKIIITALSRKAVTLPKISVYGYLQKDTGDNIINEEDYLDAYPLHNLPNSVQSVGQNFIEKVNAKNVIDLLDYINGIEYFESSFGAHPQFYSRGLITPLGIDGKFHRRTTLVMDTSALERIDVLQGPSMNYLPPGGLLNFVTKKPFDVSRIEYRFSGGTYDYLRGELDINHPLTSALTTRLVFAHEDLKGIKDFSYETRSVFAPSALYKLNDTSELLFSGYYLDEKEYPETHTLHPDIVGEKLPRERTIGLPWARSETEDIFLTLDYTNTEFADGKLQFGINWSTATTTAWNTELTHINNGIILPIYLYFENRRDRSYGIDIAFERATSTFGIDSLTRVGFDYQYYFSTSPNHGFIFNAENFDPFAPDYSLPEPARPDKVGEYTLIGDVYGAYISHNMYFTDKLTQSTILRYEDMEFGGEFNDADAGFDWEPSGEYKEFTSQVGLNYSFSDTTSTHITYTDSFTHQEIPDASDVTNLFSDDAEFVPPIKNKQFEVSLKKQWLDKKLHSSLTAYRLAQTGVQTFSYEPTTFAVTNGKARKQISKGISLSVNGRIHKNIDVIANSNYNDSFITTQSAGAIGFYIFTVPSDRNFRLRNTARIINNLWLYFDSFSGMFKSFEFGMGAQYVGDRYADNGNEFELPSYTRLDGTLHYKVNPTTDISINIKNLTNREYYTSSIGDNYDLSNTLNTGPVLKIEEGKPREVFLNFRSRFDF